MEKQYKVILCGPLYDGVTAEWKQGWKHGIDGKQIAGIGPQVRDPEHAETTYLRKYQLAPGLIDAHMHMEYYD